MSSGGSENTTQTNKVELSPEQKQVFEMALPFITQAAENPVQPFQGSTIAGFTPLELQAQQQAVAQAQGAASDVGQSAAEASQFLLDPAILDPSSNPALGQQADAITSRLSQNLTESVLPSIRSGSTVSGGMFSGGNTRQGIAEGLAIDRTGENIGDSLATLYGNAYNTGIGAMGDALRTTPLTQAASTFGPGVVGQVGAQQRAMEQAILDAQINRDLLTQQAPFLQAQDLLSLISGMPGGTGVSTVEGATPQTSPVSGALGGALTGGSLFGPIGAGIGGASGLLLSLL